MTYANSADVYNRTGLTTNDIAVAVMTDFLATADHLVDRATGRNWNTAAATATDYIDGYDFFEYDNVDDPIFVTARTRRQYEHVQLSRGNISTLTSLKFLNLDGTTSTTVQATDVVTNNASFRAGLLKLEANSIPTGFGNIEVVYTYGVATNDPGVTLAKELAAYYAALQSFVAVSGGTFDDVTSFTLGNRTVSLGEPYVNIREAINQTLNHIERVLALIGGRIQMVVI